MVAAAVQYVYNYQVDIHQYAKKEEEKRKSVMVAAAVQYIYNHQVDIHQYAKKLYKKRQLWLQLWIFSKYIIYNH